MEVFTISGPDVQLLGDAAVDQACARKVAPLVIAGSAGRIGAVGAGLFGTYKLFKKGWAPGVVSLVVGGVLWFASGRLLATSVARFDACRKG